MLRSKFGAAAVVALISALLIVGVVYAVTIVVDGVRDAAWNGSGGQTPGGTSDGNEGTIDDRYDISVFSYTNDALGSAPWGYMYFLFETYGNFDSIYPVATPQVIVCMDVDNSTGTGTTASGYCNNMSGIDRRVYFYPSLGTVSVQRWTGAAFVNVSTPPGGMRAVAYNDPGLDGIADLPYIEGGIDLQSINITNTATCIGNIPIAIYYDNGILDNEDQIPNSGTFNIGCGTPTAIALNNLEAKADTQNNTAVIILAASVVAILGLAGAAIRRRTA